MAGTVDHSRADLAEKVLRHYCGLLLAIIIMLVLSSCEESELTVDGQVQPQQQELTMMMMMMNPCDEIYVVREGETLQTISEKCGDPFIVEANPHIHDPDDVFPGLLIKITPFNRR